MWTRVLNWLDSRTGYRALLHHLLDEPLPPGTGWAFTTGSVVSLLLGVQVVTGVVLGMYYVPSPALAWDSVQYIMQSLPMGWLVRGLHFWGASFIVVATLVHLGRVFVLGSYKAPREVTWLTGLVSLLMILGFALSGYLLPWDQKAYWATTVTVNVARSAPVVGEALATMLRGGEHLGALTLGRWYAAHVFILPLLLGLFVVAHLALMRRHGISGPITPRQGAPVAFFPWHVMKDTVMMAGAFSGLLVVALLLKAPLDPVANPADASYVPRPEWYFLWLVQLLKYFPGPLEPVGTQLVPGALVGFLLLLPFLLLTAWLPAQRFFQPVTESNIQLPESAERKMIPNQYRTYRLDVAGLSAFLSQIPMEFTAAAQAKTAIVEFPSANGAMERFAVWKVLAVEPVVYDQQPELRTFGGVSLDNPGKTIRGSVTVRGFQLLIMKPDMEIEYIDPYAAGQTNYYMAYDRRDYPEAMRSKAPGAWIPSDDAAETADFPYVPAAEQRNLLPELVNLRVFRIGVACTGEFSQDQGGTLDLAWAAVIEKTNRVSAIFERDIALRLQLVASSKAATFLNPSTDPFVGTTVDAWMTQAPTVLAQFVGENNYDVGHVYARYLGGAAIGVAGGIACVGSKGRGCSAGYGDYGDGFISVIGQEIGHQFSAGHTWNRCGGGGGRDGGEAYEPGSGTTIMSYAGACGSDNVQNYTDLYYHSGSIEKIRFFYTLGSGVCASSNPTGNHRPEVTLPYQDNFFIPIGTPFELRGSATDADGDTLSYVWEQVDLGPECPLDSPLSSAPLFRTRPPRPKYQPLFPAPEHGAE